MTQVAPVLTARCGGCHGFNDADGANTFVRGNASRPACSSVGARIVASNATGSLLYQKVAGTQTCGGRMPPNCTGNNCLPQTQLDLIRDWINAGAPSN